MSQAAAVRILVVVAGLALMGAERVGAGQPELLVLHPGSPGTPEQAEPVMASLAAWIRNESGVKVERARYEVDRKAGLEALLEQGGPALAIVSPEVYVALRERTEVELLAQAVREGRTFLHYHLVTREAVEMASLEGKGIWSSHVHNPVFAARVLLMGKLDFPGSVSAHPTSAPLKALRDLVRGKVDAVLLDELQYEAMQALKSLDPKPVSIFVSDPVPTAPVVAFPARLPAESRARVARAFLEMEGKQEGRELLEVLQVTRFAEPDKVAFDDLFRRATEPGEKK